MIVIISRFILMLLSFSCQCYLYFYIYKATKAKKVTKFQARTRSQQQLPAWEIHMSEFFSMLFCGIAVNPCVI